MNETRIAAMRQRLESALTPEFLEIIDDSHKHVGHAGARDGRGHFTVRIRADALAGKSLLEQHRAIYAAMGRLMETDIHALAIKVLGPEG